MEEVVDKPEENIEDIKQEYQEILCKLKKFDPTRLNIVLTLGGSFYPIHKNHVKTIEYASQKIQELRSDINIMGLYLIPTQIDCLAKKMNLRHKELREVDSHRLKMCQLMVEDNPDVMIYSFLYKATTNKGLAVATLRLQDSLNKHFNNCSKTKEEQIQAITVTGMDKFELLARKSKNGPIVFVENRPLQNEGVNRKVIIEKNKLQKYENNIIIVEDTENGEEMSSTLIRNLCNSGGDFSKLVTPALYQYHLNNNIKYPVAAPIQPEVQISEEKLNSIPKIEDIIEFKFDKINFDEITELDMTQVLGQGVQAKVSKAKYKGKQVALKIYSLEAERSSKIKCFLRELRALTLSKHKNVIGLYGAGQYKQYLYIVLELVSGLNVLDFISRNRKYWDEKPFNKEFIRSLSELCEGIHQMSISGVLHRDIQTKNILIAHEDTDFDYSKLKQFDEKCTLKICDFGLSALDEDKDKIVRGSTRHYSPESMESKLSYFPQSDVYMIGNSIWELIYCKIIFTHLNVGEVHQKVRAGEREAFDKKCPKELQDVIEKCWRHNYLERPTFLEIAQDLRVIYETKKEAKTEVKEEGVDKEQGDSDKIEEVD